MTLSNRTRWLGLVALAVALLAVTAVGRKRLLTEQPVQVAVADPDCDLRAGPCTARFADGGEVTLDLAPRGIPLAQPLAVRVATRGLAVDALALDVVGVDMDMGYNRLPLLPVGADDYQGQGMLPVCVRRRMMWEARVLVTTPRGLLAAPFRFATER